MLLLKFRNGSDEGMTAPIGLQASVHKSDDGLPLLQHRAVRKYQWRRRWMRTGDLKINAVVNDTDLSAPVLRKTAGLDVGG